MSGETALYRGYVLRFTSRGVDVETADGEVLGRFVSSVSARAYVKTLRKTAVFQPAR